MRSYLPAQPPPLKFSPPHTNKVKRFNSTVAAVGATPMSATSVYRTGGVTPATAIAVPQSRTTHAPTSSSLQFVPLAHTHSGIGIPQSSWESGTTTPTTQFHPSHKRRAGASRRPPTQAELDLHDIKTLSPSLSSGLFLCKVLLLLNGKTVPRSWHKRTDQLRSIRVYAYGTRSCKCRNIMSASIIAASSARGASGATQLM